MIFKVIQFYTLIFSLIFNVVLVSGVQQSDSVIYIHICIHIHMLLLSHFSRVRLCATPQTAAHQAPRSLGFSRQEHWSGLPFPSPIHESEEWKWSRSVMSDPQRPHGLQSSRLLHPWDLRGKSNIYILFHIIFIYFILFSIVVYYDIKYSSLCYTVGPCCFLCLL